MTRSKAVVEARTRWGFEGRVFDRIEDAGPRQWKVMDGAIERVGRFWVGQAHFGPIYGNGDTWEAAFADADRREQEKQK